MKKNKYSYNEAKDLFKFISEYESVKRFSRNHLVRPENLVHHVGVVSIICAYIVNKMTEHYEEELFSTQECCSIMMRAVVHDMDEIITGDIVRPAKYSSGEMLALIKKLEEESIGKVIEKFDLPVRWEEDWHKAKQDIPGLVVKAADLLAVVMTCYREIRLYSNNQFISVAEECLPYMAETMEKFTQTEGYMNDDRTKKIVNFINCMLIQGRTILEDVCPRIVKTRPTQWEGIWIDSTLRS